MRLVRNTGNDLVVDLVSSEVTPGQSFDIVTPQLSIFGFSALRDTLSRITGTRMILQPNGRDLMLLGDEVDRAARNCLQTRWLVKKCEVWLRESVDLRPTAGSIPQGILVMRDSNGEPQRVVHGAFSLTNSR